MSILGETQKILAAARARSASILVAYSGGKDSIVVMDICHRMFEHVEGFFMYLVPGLECVELAIEKARIQYGIKIRTYPHWISRKLIANGVYTSQWFGFDNLPKWSLQDVYAMAMKDSGIYQIATGAKKADSAWRRRFMATAHFEAILNPIAKWHKYDVISYLRSHAIPEPASSGKSATGIDLSVPSLLWLHDTFPADFRKLCEVFPFAEAVIARRRIYGLAA